MENPHTALTNRRFSGVIAAPGLADGPAAIYDAATLSIPRYPCDQPEPEISRFRVALAISGEELARLREKVERDGAQAEAQVFEAHQMFLEDESLWGMAEETIQTGINAEAAWMDAVEHFAGMIGALPDPTLSARADDVRDVGQRVLRHLLGFTESEGLRLARPSIVVARDLAPSQTAELDKKLVLGFCTAGGGPTSHTAILAKALGIPAMVGLGSDLLEVTTGDLILVDAQQGEVTANPDEATLCDFHARMSRAADIAQAEIHTAGEPAVTRDGFRAEVVANIGSREDAIVAIAHGAEGVGLLRTEFLYLNRRDAPSEEEQLINYQAILEVMGGRPVVVRTLDIGGDKDVPYLDLGHEDNPFLGWRAIRIGLDRPELLKTQLRALLRASPGHDLRIMFPMVATLDEVRSARAFFEEARTEVEQAGHAVAEHIQLGIMVEIPSAAVMADRLAREVDFFSIGTNDLTQYTLAADRGNERVARLGDACHPAVLRLIRQVIEAGHRQGIWVGLCGELGGDSEGVPVLLGLGLDEFSIAPGAIPHSKTIIRRWSRGEAAHLAAACLELDSAGEVRSLVCETTSQLLVERPPRV